MDCQSLFRDIRNGQYSSVTFITQGLVGFDEYTTQLATSFGLAATKYSGRDTGKIQSYLRKLVIPGDNAKYDGAFLYGDGTRQDFDDGGEHFDATAHYEIVNSSPGIQLPTPQADNQIIKDTTQSTQVALVRGGDSCRMIFASSSFSSLGNPRQLLEFWDKNNRIKKDILLDFTNDDGTKSLAEVTGIRKDSSLNLSSIFFTNSIVLELETLLNQGKKKADWARLSPEEARTLVFLHETGHGTGKYAHGQLPNVWFGGYDGRAPKNNIPEIYNKCLKNK